MINNYGLNLKEKMQQGGRPCDQPGIILLVEENKLRGITPYVVRETERLLYLDVLAVIN